MKGALIVSCQPVPGDPMGNAAAVAGFARAALAGGARGLRLKSIRYARAVRQAVEAPIVGIVKDNRTDPGRRMPRKAGDETGGTPVPLQFLWGYPAPERGAAHVLWRQKPLINRGIYLVWRFGGSLARPVQAPTFSQGPRAKKI